MRRRHATGYERRFDNRQAQIALAVFGAVVIVLGVAGNRQPAAGSKIEGLVYLLAGSGFAWRALTSSAVVVREHDVLLRGFVRTRRVLLDDVASAEVAVGRTGMNGFGREYLVITRRDGSLTSFKELNSKPSTTAATEVRRAVDAIRGAMRRRAAAES